MAGSVKRTDRCTHFGVADPGIAGRQALASSYRVTQNVVFIEDEAGPFALAEWDRVFEIAGDLMEQNDHYPRRERVREYPDQANLDAVGLGEL